MTWRRAAVSQVGTSHLTSGTPCQDASTVRVLETPLGEPVLLAIAADGAGSAKRAEQGARLVVATFQVQVEKWVSGGMSLGDIQRADIEHWIQVTQDILRTVAQPGESIDDYASTVLGCVVGDGVTLWWQIGDGAVVVDAAAGDEDRSGATTGYLLGCWPQHGEYANETSFVTSTTAAAQVQWGILPQAARRVSVFTDGLQHLLLRDQDHSVHTPWFDAQFAYIAQVPEASAGELNQALGQMLSGKRFTDETDDDRTLILACQV